MCGLAARSRGAEHLGLVPVVAKAVWVAGALAVCSGEPSYHRLKRSPPSVCLDLQHSQENGVCLCVDEMACVIGVAVCGVFRANLAHGIKYEEQY